MLARARKNAKTAVNLSMVYAYFEIGRMIVEEEQHGANRAAYGTQLLKELSAYLTKNFGKGFSVGNLKNIRQFYKVYSEDQIGETVFSQFGNLPAVSTGRKFYLSWSHYLKLMRIDNIEERHFYEIESVKNDWSLSELKRQYNSSLYERLALSTDKDKVYRLALEGQTVESPKDAVKDPYVLEFLGLPELPSFPKQSWKAGSSITCSNFSWSWGQALPSSGGRSALPLMKSISWWIWSSINRLLPSKEALQKLLQEHITDEDGGEDE